jgi:hypothetical protein
MRKRTVRKHYALINPITHAIAGARVVGSDALDKLRMQELSAIESFVIGRATEQDWRSLADMVNLTEVMAVDFAIEPDAQQAAESAQEALLRSFHRAKDGKALLLDGPGLQALRECFAWHDEQRKGIARSQYEQAIAATVAKIKNKAPGVTFVGSMA